MGGMLFDWTAWDEAHKPTTPLEPATESLNALQERLCGEHCDKHHSGNGVRWELDLVGVYCLDCLDVGYHFNLYAYDGFLRVIDGFEPETDVREVAFWAGD